MKIVVVDAFDSFVYILRQYLLGVGAEPIVVRENQLDFDEVRAMRPRALLLGPGPGHPAASRHVDVLRAFGEQVPILGVCLGHQAIGLAFDAEVAPAQHLMHGKTSRIRHDGAGLFTGLPQGFSATRYHSLVVPRDSVPNCLKVTATSEDDQYVMGLRHRRLPIESVQFHPESVCTEHGLRMIQNFIRTCSLPAARSRPARGEHRVPGFGGRRPAAAPYPGGHTATG